MIEEKFEDGKIEIPLSRIKILLLFIGAMIFVILGLLFISSPEDWTASRFESPEIIRILGIVSTLFFGICSISIGRKLFDKKTGLIIDKNGITNNTNATGIGLIEWDDITGISKVEIASTKILMLKTNKPDKYIEKAKNGLAKRAMKANNKMYGSPISIISNSLKIKFNDLEKLLKEELKKRKQTD